MVFNLIDKEPDERPVYITGNFNSWNPEDDDFKFTNLGGGKFKLTIPDELLPAEIEYKFTKGGWESVELSASGAITPNRKTSKAKAAVIDTVSQWRLNWGPFKKEFFPKAEVISENFYIPQLDRYRKVWALLPYDYDTSRKSYPVLYLQDAQNLFNEGSGFGNWEIDKKLAVLAEYGRGDIIVIAVDHGSANRIREYIFDNDGIAQGSEGKKYIRFITDTLKPYVDAHYRTKKEREFTGIGGSSLGALISIYGGFLYPEVYSKLMLFSPSLWVEPKNNFPMMTFKKPYTMKVYLYGGELEGEKMVRRIRRFAEALQQWELDQIYDFETRVHINSSGLHQEFYWSQEFPRAVEWLFYDNAENPVEKTPVIQKI